LSYPRHQPFFQREPRPPCSSGSESFAPSSGVSFRVISDIRSSAEIQPPSIAAPQAGQYSMPERFDRSGCSVRSQFQQRLAVVPIVSIQLSEFTVTKAVKQSPCRGIFGVGTKYRNRVLNFLGSGLYPLETRLRLKQSKMFNPRTRSPAGNVRMGDPPLTPALSLGERAEILLTYPLPTFFSCFSCVTACSLRTSRLKLFDELIRKGLFR
jgi:hypothetical protein